MVASDSHDVPGAFDSVLVLSFGGPEQPDEVMPFLRQVTGGRVPDSRLQSVAEHYRHFGGRSPINDQNRRLVGELARALAAAGRSVPIVLANRHWRPFTAEAVGQLAETGRREVAVIATSGFSSLPGCRAYREDYEQAARNLPARERPRFRKIRLWYNHPLFLDCWADRVVEAVASLSPGDGSDSEGPHLLFTAHSLPTSMADDSGPSRGRSRGPSRGPSRGIGCGEEGGAYVAQHRFAADRVVRRVEARLGRTFGWELAFQSQSGSPGSQWLQPGVEVALRDLAVRGGRRVVVVPIGFLTDHIEVQWDLGVEARGLASDLGLEFALAGTVGDDPRLIAMLADLIFERERGVPAGARPAEGPDGPWPDECPIGCCGAEGRA